MQSATTDLKRPRGDSFTDAQAPYSSRGAAYAAPAFMSYQSGRPHDVDAGEEEDDEPLGGGFSGASSLGQHRRRRTRSRASSPDSEAEDAAAEYSNAARRLWSSSGGLHPGPDPDHPPPRKRAHIDVKGFANLSLNLPTRGQGAGGAYTVHSPPDSSSSPLPPGAEPAYSQPYSIPIPGGAPAATPPPAPPCSPERSTAPIAAAGGLPPPPAPPTSPLGEREEHLAQPVLQRSSSSVSNLVLSMDDSSATSSLGPAQEPSMIEEPAATVPEVDMRERRAPSSWEYEKDKIWIESLDTSSESDDAEYDASTSLDAAAALPSARLNRRSLDEHFGGLADDESEKPPGKPLPADGEFGSGSIDGASFLFNANLIQKLEEEAKRRVLASQQLRERELENAASLSLQRQSSRRSAAAAAQPDAIDVEPSEAAPARSWRKSKLYRLFGGARTSGRKSGDAARGAPTGHTSMNSSCGSSRAPSTCSSATGSGGTTTPAELDPLYIPHHAGTGTGTTAGAHPLDDKSALILWRSPEEVLQSHKAHANAAGPDAAAGIRNLLDFGAAAAQLKHQQQQETTKAQELVGHSGHFHTHAPVRTQTVDVDVCRGPGDEMEID